MYTKSLQGVLAICEFHYCDFSKLSKNIWLIRFYTCLSNAILSLFSCLIDFICYSFCSFDYQVKICLRDHPFKMLAFFKGKGVKSLLNLRWIVVKNWQQQGPTMVKNCENFADVSNGWFLMRFLANAIFSQSQKLYKARTLFRG